MHTHRGDPKLQKAVKFLPVGSGEKTTKSSACLIDLVVHKRRVCVFYETTILVLALHFRATDILAVCGWVQTTGCEERIPAGHAGEVICEASSTKVIIH